jgi:hypothetical protein
MFVRQVNCAHEYTLNIMHHLWGEGWVILESAMVSVAMLQISSITIGNTRRQELPNAVRSKGVPSAAEPLLRRLAGVANELFRGITAKAWLDVVSSCTTATSG